MEDEVLADEIIARLNDLIRNSDVRWDIHKLIEARVPCTLATLHHPTIQAHAPDVDNPAGKLGLLGLLNGFVGAIPPGSPKSGWGYITAVFDEGGNLAGFQKTIHQGS